MESPISGYIDSVLGSLLTIAPEKEKDLIYKITKYHITPELDIRKKFIFKANPTKKTIGFSITALEYLWASAYTYWVTYQEAYSANQNEIKELIIPEIPRLREATDLLTWARKNILNNQYEPWPDGLPKPIKNNISGSDEDVATEYFLCSVAWILHHELAHIYQGHSATITFNSVEEEREADKAATFWVLSNKTDDKIISKISIGIAIANLAIFSLSLDSNILSNNTHPRSYERIFDNLEIAQLDKNHVVYFFTIVNMKLHLDNKKIEVNENLMHSNARECLQDYCILLSREK